MSAFEKIFNAIKDLGERYTNVENKVDKLYKRASYIGLFVGTPLAILVAFLGVDWKKLVSPQELSPQQQAAISRLLINGKDVSLKGFIKAIDQNDESITDYISSGKFSISGVKDSILRLLKSDQLIGEKAVSFRGLILSDIKLRESVDSYLSYLGEYHNVLKNSEGAGSVDRYCENITSKGNNNPLVSGQIFSSFSNRERCRNSLINGTLIAEIKSFEQYYIDRVSMISDKKIDAMTLPQYVSIGLLPEKDGLHVLRNYSALTKSLITSDGQYGVKRFMVLASDQSTGSEREKGILKIGVTTQTTDEEKWSDKYLLPFRIDFLDKESMARYMGGRPNIGQFDLFALDFTLVFAGHEKRLVRINSISNNDSDINLVLNTKFDATKFMTGGASAISENVKLELPLEATPALSEGQKNIFSVAEFYPGQRSDDISGIISSKYSKYIAINGDRSRVAVTRPYIHKDNISGIPIVILSEMMAGYSFSGEVTDDGSKYTDTFEIRTVSPLNGGVAYSVQRNIDYDKDSALPNYEFIIDSIKKKWGKPSQFTWIKNGVNYYYFFGKDGNLIDRPDYCKDMEASEYLGSTEKAKKNIDLGCHAFLRITVKYNSETLVYNMNIVAQSNIILQSSINKDKQFFYNKAMTIYEQVKAKRRVAPSPNL